MRILLWLLPTCLALTACNVALSDHPMLAGEPRSPLKLRDGLWSLEDADCRFKAERPRRHWPKCATWVVIDDGKVVGGKDLPPGDLPVELVIADGTPTSSWNRPTRTPGAASATCGHGSSPAAW